MKIQSITCPNCTAALNPADQIGTAFVCPYCGTHLWIEEPEAASTAPAPEQPATISVSDGPLPLSIPDCCTAEALTDFPQLRRVLEEICALFDAGHDAQSLLPELLQALQDKKEATTATSREAEFSTIREKLKGVLMPDETLLLYKTTAFFNRNKLKAGVYVTDRKIGAINGKTITCLPYEELHTLLLEKGVLDVLVVYPNGMTPIFLTLLTLTESEFAKLIAFILCKAQEAQGSDSKIQLKMKTSAS